MKEKFLLIGGSRIYYTVSGNGPAVMLVHGFGEDSRIWKHQVAFLQNSYKLILLDLPGSGQSEPINSDNVTVEDYADILKAILEKEEIKKCILLGHSMGGYITMAFVEKYPDMLRAFGLIHSTAFPDDEEKKQSRQKAIGIIREKGAGSFLSVTLPGLFHDAKKYDPEIRGLLDDTKNVTGKTLIQYYEAMIARPDRKNILKDTPLPVLLIAGLYDKAVPFPQSLTLAYMPEICHFEILRNSAHMGMLEETDKCNNIFSSFLANPLLRQ